MRLVIEHGGVELEFVRPNVDGAYPWLGDVGTLLLRARAGHIEGVGVGESANMTVALDNRDRQASTLLERPLRDRATIYDDDNDLFFDGIVQAVDYGPTLTLGIED